MFCWHIFPKSTPYTDFVLIVSPPQNPTNTKSEGTTYGVGFVCPNYPFTEHKSNSKRKKYLNIKVKDIISVFLLFDVFS